MDVNIKEFKQRLKSKKDEIGFSATQIAKKLEVSVATVTNWLNGEYLPRPETLAKLANLLGVTVAWLKYGTSETKVEDGGEKYKPHGGWEPIRLGKDWEFVDKAIKILSTNTSYKIALMSNINAFYRAIQTEQDLHDTKTELENTKEKMSELENRVKALEDAEAEKKQQTSA